VGLNLVFIVAAALVLSIHAGSTNENEWFLAASLFNLSAGTAGIMIRNPKQWFFVVAIVGLEAYLFLSLGFFDSGDLGVNSAILYPFYALALAVGAGSAQRMLLNRAHEIDELQNMVVLEAVSLKTAHEVDSYIESLRRAVHEVVLNTLTAISRGSLNDSPESRRLIRDRSAEAIVILSDLSQPSANVSTTHAGTTIDTLADLLVECAQRGIHVRITGDVNSKPPEHVTEGLVAAAREAVINSLRHSELTELVIRVSEGRDYCIEIEDNGLGFDPNQTPHGFGLTSLLNSTDALAIAIISHSTRGTVVQICASRRREGFHFTFESRPHDFIVLPSHNVVCFLDVEHPHVMVAIPKSACQPGFSQRPRCRFDDRNSAEQDRECPSLRYCCERTWSDCGVCRCGALEPHSQYSLDRLGVCGNRCSIFGYGSSGALVGLDRCRYLMVSYPTKFSCRINCPWLPDNHGRCFLWHAITSNRSGKGAGARRTGD